VSGTTQTAFDISTSFSRQCNALPSSIEAAARGIACSKLSANSATTSAAGLNEVDGNAVSGFYSGRATACNLHDGVAICPTPP